LFHKVIIVFFFKKDINFYRIIKNYIYNPVYGSAHIVIFYKYVGGNTNRLYYFDPYYGRAGGLNSMKVEDIPSAIQGNLPYLRVVPWWNTKV